MFAEAVAALVGNRSESPETAFACMIVNYVIFGEKKNDDA